MFRIICAAMLLVGCQDEVQTRLDLGPSTGILDYAVEDAAPDVHIIDWTPPDAWVDPCIGISSGNELFCECKPECCQTQLWYCPPNGLGVSAAQVIMNICDENFEVCDRSIDLTCPPNEILSRSSCNTILECPPGIDNDITITVRCEIEGVEGRQEILCAKGDITYGECVICEPSEERCNYQDDDCDGQVDEFQTNVCGTCGPVPSDVCDGADNDCDGLTDEGLVRECQTACDRGIEACSEGNWISCTARQPVDEECDGEDNDCDGQVDEGLNCLCTVEDVGNLIPCAEPPLICGQGFKTCECANPNCSEMRMTDCAALCVYLPPNPEVDCDHRFGIILQQEECNNFDEDCDEQIDENLTQACYTGEPETLFVGVCAPGEVYCRRGEWGSDRENAFTVGHCAGEVTPQEEICDGADNDCDGEVDYGEEIRETDILFIVDWSGSMDDEIEAVKIALNRFATHFAAEEPLRWGLIVAPKEAPVGDDELLVLVSDIVPFEQFLAAFASLGNEGMDTGSEMLLDAVYLAVRGISPAANVDIATTTWWRNTGSVPQKENFIINWRPESHRIVIVFSDEPEQSYLRDAADPEGPVRPITEEVVQDVVRAGINLKLYAFSTGSPLGGGPHDWEDLALAGSGTRFPLTSSALSMYNNLMSIIDEACLPRDDEQASLNRVKKSNFLISPRDGFYDHFKKVCYSIR